MSTFAADVFGGNIETAIEQNAVADSLLGDTDGRSINEIFEGTEYAAEPLDETRELGDGNQVEAEQEPEPSPEYAAAEESIQELHDEIRDAKAIELANEQLQQAPQNQPSSYEQLTEQFQLNDPKDGAQTLQEFAETSQMAPELAAQIPAEQFQDHWNRTALSVASIYDAANGDPSRVGPMNVELAGRQWGESLLAATGVDARLVPFDAYQLGATILDGAWNVLQTYNALGRNPNISAKQLNSPEMAEHFYGNFLRAFGNDGQFSRAEAVRYADFFANALLRPLTKIQQTQAQQAQPREQQSAHRSSRSRSGSKRSAAAFTGEKTFTGESNQDIFGPDAVEIYQREHGRL